MPPRDPLRFPLGLALALATAAAQAAANRVVVVEDPANGDDVGRFPDLVLDASGEPKLVYADRTNGNLRYAWCTSPTCDEFAASELPTPINETSLASDAALILGADGNVRVVAGGNSTDNFYLWQCLDDPCDNVEIRAVDNAVSLALGGPSVALDLNGLPAASYFVRESGDTRIRFLRCNDADCDSVTANTAYDPADELAGPTSLTFGADDMPRLAFRNETSDALLFTRCSLGTCLGGGVIETLDDEPAASVGKGAVMVLRTTGEPLIVHRDEVNETLRITACLDADCTGAESRVAAPLMTGAFTGDPLDVAIAPDGRPNIVYHDGDGARLWFVRCATADCQGALRVTYLAQGAEPAIAIGPDGLPIIAYYAAGESALEILFCGNANCDSFIDDGFEGSP